MEKSNKILIIDDEQINLDFFDVMLSRLGFDIILAENGEEGLEKIISDPPDLIILDNIMPRLTGWELTKLLKQNDEYRDYREIPIIMFSGMDAVKDKIEGFELGIEDYITKPFNFSEVLARIRAVLRNHALSSQIIHRERKITLVESLNKSLLYFTKHLKTPVLDLMTRAETLESSDPKKVEELRVQVLEECRQTLATLAGLEDELQKLDSEGSRIKEAELTIQDLDARFQEHFRSWQDKVPN